MHNLTAQLKDYEKNMLILLSLKSRVTRSHHCLISKNEQKLSQP